MSGGIYFALAAAAAWALTVVMPLLLPEFPPLLLSSARYGLEVMSLGLLSAGMLWALRRLRARPDALRG